LIVDTSEKDGGKWSQFRRKMGRKGRRGIFFPQIRPLLQGKKKEKKGGKGSFHQVKNGKGKRIKPLEA